MSDPNTYQEARAENVIDALRRVMRDLPGIAKSLDSTQGYRYRGIEQITVEAQPLFARHGVLFAPTVESYEVIDILVNNRPWTDTRLMVRYRVYGPGGRDDFIDVGPLLGIGRDNSDKGANKAMSQAFKYALLQTFTIADSKDDGDATTHEADARRREPTAAQKARSEFGERVRRSPCRDQFKKWAKEQGFPDVPASLRDDQLAKAVEWVDFAESAYEHDHETPPEAAVSPHGPSGGVDAPIPAPPAELDRDAQRAHAAAEYVKTLTPVELLTEFGARNTTAPRTKAEQRSTLADILFLDESWVAPGQEALL